MLIFFALPAIYPENHRRTAIGWKNFFAFSLSTHSTANSCDQTAQKFSLCFLNTLFISTFKSCWFLLLPFDFQHNHLFSSFFSKNNFMIFSFQKANYKVRSTNPPSLLLLLKANTLPSTHYDPSFFSARKKAAKKQITRITHIVRELLFVSSPLTKAIGCVIMEIPWNVISDIWK